MRSKIGSKQASYTKFIVATLIVAGVGFGGHQWYVNYKINNPVLNSPSDINDELIQKIITNSIDSLTINYEFTMCPKNVKSPEPLFHSHEVMVHPRAPCTDLCQNQAIHGEAC